MSPVEIWRAERSWGCLVVQRLGEGREAQIEFRAFVIGKPGHPDRSVGVSIKAEELTRVIERLTHERDTLLGHPKHTGAKR